MRPHALLAAALVLSLASADASADAVETLIGECFARVYDADYLAAHGSEQFAVIKIGFSDFNGTALARIDLTSRTRLAMFYYFANCSRDLPGGVGCAGCAGESCDPNGETFEIKLRGEDRIELINAATGITAKTAGDSTQTLNLPARGAYRAVVLERIDNANCGE
jgi:hypothetical protein